ncbi:MAG: hypothetical protein LBF16_11235 [Pseudomonadales bacterium]|jgi:hypothetical protein|nr:hypothetical protein [Pseudomonadales bacterium]
MKQIVAYGFACLALLAYPALAHHPVQAKFDTAQQASLIGRVTKVDWANPHAHVFITLTNTSPNTSPTNTSRTPKWAIELPSPIELEWGGWRPDTLAVGDTITVEGPRARDGSEQVWAERINKADGSAVFTLPGDILESQLGAKVDAPAPRWPDGHPRLGPEPGQSGYWSVPSLRSLVENGVNVAMDEHGILANIEDAKKIAPFQDWARDLYVYRQRKFLSEDPLFLYCIPPGGPRMFQVPYGVQLLEQPRNQRVTVLMSSGNSNWRLIPTDGREPIGQVAGNDNNPLFFGHSTGRWEGDSFTVDSTGFNESFWFSNGGLPHTRQLHLTERFTRKDWSTLEYSVTIDDPGAYTRPWTSTSTLQWIANQEMPDYFCQDNRP